MALKTGLPLELNKPQGSDFFDEQRDIAANMQVINDWAAIIEAHRTGTTGEEHALAVPDGRAGFFSGTDKAKLDTIEAGGISRDNGDLRWLGIDAVAVDANKLGGSLYSNYARQDISNTFAALQTFGSDIYLNAASGVDGLFRFRANAVDKWDIKFDQASGNIVFRDLVQGRDVAVFKTADGKLNAPVGLQEAGTDLVSKYARLENNNTFGTNTTLTADFLVAKNFTTLEKGVTFGLTSGGTYNGNVVFNPDDRYPQIAWRSGNTVMAKLMANASDGYLFVDSSAGFKFRTPASGSQTTLLTLTTAGAMTLLAGLTATKGTFTDLLKITRADASAIEVRSGSDDANVDINLGRTAGEAQLGIAGLGNDYVTGTQPGDVILRTQADTQKLFLAVGSANPVLTLSNTAVNVTQALQMGGTQFMDTSRNLSNLGTVSSGAITSTGNLTVFSGYMISRRANASDWAFYADVNTDTVSRYAVRADGRLEWGAGGSTARDTALYRSGANSLKTDGALYATGGFSLTRAASTEWGYSAFVTGDTQARFAIHASGQIHWGPGGEAALDTTLYRSAADTLKTDDAFVVGTSLAVGTGLTVGSSISLTTNSVNHFIREGTGWIWKSDGLTGGTTRGGVWADSSGNLRLFGSTTITSDKLSVLASGNVAIGAAGDTGEKLQVTGDAAVTGKVTATEIQVKSAATAKRFKLDYNETDDTLDFIFSES